MKKVVNQCQCFISLSLLLSLLAFSSSFTFASAASSKDLSLITNNPVKLDPNDFIFTDENGSVLNPSDLEVYMTSDEGMITPYANVISKTMTVTKQNFGSPYLASSITVSEPSGYLTPWKGTLPLVKSYTVETFGGIIYYSVYSGTVYATTR